MCVCSLFQFIKHISAGFYVYDLPSTGKNMFLGKDRGVPLLLVQQWSFMKNLAVLLLVVLTG